DGDPAPAKAGARLSESTARGCWGESGLTRAQQPERAQAVPTKAARRYWLTACSGTRKERPTRMASSSPEWTSRYTVIFETRMIVATSATVRNRTSLRGVSLAIIALFRAKPSTLDRIQRTSHVRIPG